MQEHQPAASTIKSITSYIVYIKLEPSYVGIYSGKDDSVYSTAISDQRGSSKSRGAARTSHFQAQAIVIVYMQSSVATFICISSI